MFNLCWWTFTFQIGYLSPIILKTDLPPHGAHRPSLRELVAPAEPRRRCSSRFIIYFHNFLLTDNSQPPASTLLRYCPYRQTVWKFSFDRFSWMKLTFFFNVSICDFQFLTSSLPLPLEIFIPNSSIKYFQYPRYITFNLRSQFAQSNKHLFVRLQV